MKRCIRELEDDVFAFAEGVASKVRKIKEQTGRGGPKEGVDSEATAASREKFLDGMDKRVSAVEGKVSSETGRAGMSVFGLADLYRVCLGTYNQQNEALEELQKMVFQLGVNPYSNKQSKNTLTNTAKTKTSTTAPQENSAQPVLSRNINSTDEKVNDSSSELSHTQKEEEEETPTEEVSPAKECTQQPKKRKSCSPKFERVGALPHVHKRATSLADFGISKETQMAILASKRGSERSSWFCEPREPRGTNNNNSNNDGTSFSSESVLSRADSVLDASRRLTSTGLSSTGADTVSPKHAMKKHTPPSAKGSKSLYLPNTEKLESNAGKSGYGLPICRINKFRNK